jgi:hypothetical protein
VFTHLPEQQTLDEKHFCPVVRHWHLKSLHDRLQHCQLSEHGHDVMLQAKHVLLMSQIA